MAKSIDQKPSSSKKDTKGSDSGKAQNRRKRGKRGGNNLRGAKPNKNAAKSRPKTFPTMRETIEIDHAITRGAFDVLFDSFRSAFFHTTSILGRFGLEDGANNVHQYIIGLIDNARTEIEETTARISRDIEKRGGPSEVPRTTNGSERRTAEVPAFVVRKYLTLFPAVDRLIDTIICAENVGAISWKERTKLLKEAPAYLRSPAGRFHSLATKLGARQASSEASHAEARKQIDEALGVLLAQHQALPGVETKRPLNPAKTGTAG